MNIRRVVRINAQPAHSQQSERHEERQRLRNSSKLLHVPAIMPEEMAYVGFSPLIVALMQGKIMLQLRRHYAKVMHRVGMFSGTLQIQDVDLFPIKDIVHGIGVIVNPASLRMIYECAVPPVSQKAVIVLPYGLVELELVQDLMEVSKFILLAIVRSGLIMETSQGVGHKSELVVKAVLGPHIFIEWSATHIFRYQGAIIPSSHGDRPRYVDKSLYRFECFKLSLHGLDRIIVCPPSCRFCVEFSHNAVLLSGEFISTDGMRCGADQEDIYIASFILNSVLQDVD